MKKDKGTKNRLYVRLYDKNELDLISKLVERGDFASKSEVVAKCVELALPIVAGKQSGESKRESPDLADMIKKQGATLRDNLALTNILLNLITTMFTERSLALKGTTTNATDFENGQYEFLPEHYQAILDELMK